MITSFSKELTSNEKINMMEFNAYNKYKKRFQGKGVKGKFTNTYNTFWSYVCK